MFIHTTRGRADRRSAGGGVEGVRSDWWFSVPRERLTRSDQTIEELAGFRRRAPIRPAAQREEAIQLHEAAAGTAEVSRLPPPRTTAITAESRFRVPG